MSDDPFAEYGEDNTSSPSKARMRAAEKRAAKKKTEQDYLFEEWQKWHAQKRATLMDSPWGAEARILADFLEHMKLTDAEGLLTLVNDGPWRDVPEDIAHEALGMVDRTIVYLRETHGMSPFDDGLDDDLTVFQLIKEMLTSEHHQRRAQRICDKAGIKSQIQKQASHRRRQ